MVNVFVLNWLSPVYNKRCHYCFIHFVNSMWTNFTNVLFLSCIVLNLISIKTNPFSFTTTILVLKDVNNIYWGVKRGTQEIVKPLVQVSLFVFISLIIVSFCLSWFVLIRTTDFCLIIYFNWHKAHLKSIMY